MKLMKVVMENQEVNKKLHTEENKEEENKASLDIAVFEEEVVTNKESENQLVSFLLKTIFRIMQRVIRREPKIECYVLTKVKSLPFFQ